MIVTDKECKKCNKYTVHYLKDGNTVCLVCGKVNKPKYPKEFEELFRK